MSAPWPTPKFLSRAWAELSPGERLTAFLALPADERDQFDQALEHQIDCRNSIALDEARSDAGLEPLPRRALLQAVPDLPGRPYRSPSTHSHGYRTDDVLVTIAPPAYMEAVTGESLPTGGGRIRCPLPDHEDRHPSCQVYGEPGRGWYCFGCSRGGGLIELAAYLTGIEPRGSGYWEIRAWIAERLLGDEAA